MKVLVVDGREESRQVLVAAVGQLPEVVVVGTALRLGVALQLIVELEPAVVVTGEHLLDGDAVGFVEHIRRLATPPAIVVVHQADAETTAYHTAGADQVVALERVGHALAWVRARPDPARETLQLLGRLTAGVVHDLNNYLVVLDASLELVRRRATGDAGAWPHIQTTVTAMTDLVGTLLTYARGGTPAFVPVDLGRVVEHTLAIGRRTIPDSVNVVVQIGRETPLVDGVSAELEQLVLNLVINACEAMPRGGELRVSVRRIGEHALSLEVADTGVGRTTNRPSSSKHAGAGLGLAIAERVTRSHGGSLELVDVLRGGTVAIVTLPIATS